MGKKEKKVNGKEITNSKTLKIIYGVLFCIGIIIILFNYFSEKAVLVKNAVVAEAIVVDIDDYYGSEETYEITFEYTANGKMYRKRIERSYYMNIGDTLTVHYNSENPDNYQVGNSKFKSIQMYFIGIAITIVSAVLFIFTFFKDGKMSNIKKNGIVIEATIEKINKYNLAKYISKKESNPLYIYSITCKDKENIYESGKTMYDLNEIYKKGNKKVKVYIDKNNPQKYFVDIDDYRKKS